MKILLVYPFLPHPNCAHGSGVRIFNYLKNMSKRHQITLCCFVDSGEKEEVASLEPYCSLIKPIELSPKSHLTKLSNLIFSMRPRITNNYFTGNFLNELNTLIRQNHYDIIHFELPLWVGEYINYIGRENDSATVLFQDDIMFITTLQRVKSNLFNFKGFIYWIDYLKIKRYELNIWQKFDKIITINETTRKLLGRLNGDSDISIVPNGVDTSFYKPPSGDWVKENILIFTGNYWHHPNEDAVIFFLKYIYEKIKKEIKDVKFWVIGKDASDKMKRMASLDTSVEIKGYVDDLRPYLSRASIFVTPIRMGGGMRGKILEAMAMGVPVVSTSLGLEGIEAQAGLHALIADAPFSFSNAVINLIRNKELQKKLSEEARWLVESRYDWKIVYEGLDEVYSSLRQ